MNNNLQKYLQFYCDHLIVFFFVYRPTLHFILYFSPIKVFKTLPHFICTINLYHMQQDSLYPLLPWEMKMYLGIEYIITGSFWHVLTMGNKVTIRLRRLEKSDPKNNSLIKTGYVRPHLMCIQAGLFFASRFAPALELRIRARESPTRQKKKK